MCLNNSPETESISIIIPTIGRRQSLIDLLTSLTRQTMAALEIIVADGSCSDEIEQVVKNPFWLSNGLVIKHIRINPPNAVKQREAAISMAKGTFLLLLDDDVVLESDCVEQLLSRMLENSQIVAVTADFNNQSWSQPTRFWKIYLRYFMGMNEGEWQGRVIGPLLRFGFDPVPKTSVPIEWIGSGNSLIRRSAYEKVNGFSDFFLHRCTMNEDIDLALKLGRVGTLLFCPAARLTHHHAPSGRVSPKIVAEDDIFNRFMILHNTLNYSLLYSFYLVTLYAFIESVSNLLGMVKRMRVNNTVSLLMGRICGLIKIGRQCVA